MKDLSSVSGEKYFWHVWQNWFATATAALFFIAAFPIAVHGVDKIYVYRQSGGVVKFSSKPPPAGVRAEVWNSRGKSYSVMGRRSGYGGALFNDRYHDVIAREARSHGVDASLVKAVIHAESAFNPRAVSRKGALGLMQLMPGTATMHGVKRPFDPVENIRGGTKHLAMLIKKFRGDLRLALAAYNAGEEAVRQHGGVPPFAETQDYVKKVVYLKSRYLSALTGGESTRQARGVR